MPARSPMFLMIIWVWVCKRFMICSCEVDRCAGVKNGGGVLLNADCAFFYRHGKTCDLDIQSGLDCPIIFQPTDKGMTLYVEEGWIHHSESVRYKDRRYSTQSGWSSPIQCGKCDTAIGLAHWMGCSRSSMKRGM